MEAKINRIHESESELEMTLTQEEIAEDFEKEYQKEVKKIELPGFRKGKVPKGMVEKMFGNSLKHEAAENVANKRFFDFIETNNITVYDRPKMTDFKYDPDQSLTFKVTYEHTPVIELKQYKDIEIEIQNQEVTEDLLKGEVQRILEAHAENVDAEEIDGDNYTVECELQRTNVGMHETEPDNKTFPLTIKLFQEGVQPAIKEALKGKKAGEEFDFTFEDSHTHSHDDGSHEEHKETFEYKGKVISVKKTAFPEPTDEFIQKVTKGRANSLDELRSQISKDYENYFNERMDEETEYKIEDKLIELNPYTAPASFIERYHQNLVEERSKELKKSGKQYPKEYLEKTLRPAAERFVKLYFLRKEIISKENIELNDAAIRAYAELNAGKYNVEVDALMKIYEGSEDMKETILRQEYIRFLKENNSIKKVEMPAHKEA